MPSSAGAIEEDGSDSGIGAGSFLTLFVHDEAFALPLDSVQEVIRLPDLAVVPRGPASLAGLASLRGTVLPVADLRRLLRREAAPPGEATRVLVCAGEAPFGLLVDRVGQLVHADDDHLDPVNGAGAAPADAEVVSGMIRRSEGEAAIPVLRPAGLLRRDFARGTRTAAAATAVPAAQGADQPAATATREDARVALVSFAVADQEYALPAEAIEEIVLAPDSATPVAAAEAHVLGIVARRAKLLPLVSLRALLGLASAEAGDRRKLVVVRLNGAGSVGLIVDRQGEVLRVPSRLVDPVPPLLMRRRPGLEVDAICRLENGRRLVAILSPEQLFRLDGVRQAVAAANRNQEDAEVAGADAAGLAGSEEQFVVFRLGEEEFGVPIEEVEEVLRVPDLLTPVPKAPAFIEGVINLRGTVLPVVDQRRRFGLPDRGRTGRERIMVHRIGGTRTGFIVDSVTEVLRVPRSAVRPTPDLAHDQPSPLVARVLNLEQRGRLVLVLDTARLLERDEAGALATSLADV